MSYCVFQKQNAKLSHMEIFLFDSLHYDCIVTAAREKLNDISCSCPKLLCAAVGLWIQRSGFMAHLTEAGLSQDPSHIISWGSKQYGD